MSAARAAAGSNDATCSANAIATIERMTTSG
jgi:hypothetical protein